MVVQQGRRETQRLRRTVFGTLKHLADRERSWWPFSEADLVAKVAHARENHRHPMFIHRFGHLGITD